MDRQIVYPGSLPRSFDFEQFEQSAMIALGWLAQSLVGNNAWAAGLLCTPTQPASMVVEIGDGVIGQLSVVEATPFGTSLPADTTDPLMKMGVNAFPTLMAALTAPADSGTSQCWVLEGQMQEQDGAPVVLGYVNPNMPSQPFAGPNNSGATQNTNRIQRVSLQWVAGAPATTGTQVVPGVTAGWVPMYIVTLANGATTIVAADIVQHPASAFLDPTNTGRGIQPGRLLGTQTFTNPGSYVYVPPPGTNSVSIEIVGAGGSGGSSVATGDGQVSAGPGGGAGGFLRKLFLNMAQFNNVPLVVGAGGAAGAVGVQGSDGGSSTFGNPGANQLIAAGGDGGTLGPALSSSLITIYGHGYGGQGSGGDVNAMGEQGSYAFYTVGATSGRGGTSFYGGGANWLTGSGNGANAVTAGSGGGGGVQSFSNSPGVSGGNGAPGMITILAYS